MTEPDPNSLAVESYFTGLASIYAAHRPDYPADAINAIVAELPAPINAADIGCGTGISSRRLAARCQSVVGVDPNEDMLKAARAAEHDPSRQLEYRLGRAESTGLADRSIDLVVCAQAFHWFDADPTLREFKRILIPGGRLALMWNIRRTDDALTTCYEETVRQAQAQRAADGFVVQRFRAHRLERSPLFMNVRRVSFDNPQHLRWPELLGRARSASYFPKAGSLRERLEAQLLEAFNQYQQDDRVTLQQTTEVTLAEAVG